MSRGPSGKLLEVGVAEVATDANGDGAERITFREAHLTAPAGLAAPNRADAAAGAVFAASGITTTGMDVTVTGSAIISGTIRVGWVAMEKGD